MITMVATTQDSTLSPQCYDGKQAVETSRFLSQMSFNLYKTVTGSSDSYEESNYELFKQYGY
jgi:hypothetical protein